MNLREELGLTTKTSSQDIETEKQDVELGIREELGLAPIKKDQKKKRGFVSQKLAQPEGFAEDYIGQVSPFMQTGQESPLGRLPKEEVPIDGAIEMLGGQEISKPVRFREPGFYSRGVTEEQDIESPFREDFKKSVVPEIRQGKEGDQATISGAIKKSIHHYINEFGAGMPGYVGEKILGEPVVEEAKGLEKIPVGMAGTAGFIGGLPGQLFKSVIKGITEVAPKLALKTGEGMTKRVLKGAAKEAPAFGIASMLSQTGEALKQDNLEDSLDVLGNAFAGGAVTGSIFAGSRGVWARDVKDRVMRMAVGLTLLNASRGTHPFDDRDLTDKIYESGIDAFFLWKGIPKEFIKSENKIAKEVKEQGLEKDLKIVTKEGVKKGTNIYEKLSTEAIERDAKIGVELAQIELARRIDKTKKAAKVEDDIPTELGEVKVVKAKTVSKDGKYLKETKKLKKEVGDEKYYEVLNSLGIEKANQVRGKKDKATVLKALKESKEKSKEIESKEVKEETRDEWIEKRTHPLIPTSKVPLKFKTKKFKHEFEGDPEDVVNKWIKDRTHPLKPIPKASAEFKTKKRAIEFMGNKEGFEVVKLGKAKWGLREKKSEKVEETPFLKKGEVTPTEFKTKKRATEFMEKEHSDGKFEVVKLGKAKWGLKPKEVEKVEGIPELTNTVEALAFGKRATPEQNKELKRLRNESEKKSEVLRKEFRATHSKEAGEAAQKEAVKGQFFREALEWKEGEKIMKEVRSNLGLEPIELGEPKPKSKPKSKTEPKKSKIVEASEELTYGEKFPTGNIKDVDAFREGITKDIKAFRKGAKIDIDKIEKDADRLLFSREYEDFKHEKDYESFTKSNDKLFDLIQKVKEEKGLKLFERSIKKEKDVVLDSLGGQQIYEKVINRLSSKSGEQRKLTREAIKKRDEKIGKATKVDLDDINQMGKAKGFSKSEIKKIADNTFGWRTKVENLSREDADILKLKLAKLEPKEVLENEKLIYDNKSVLDSTKENFKKKVKLYDLDDAELSDYITISKGEKKSLNNSDVNNIISMIKTVNDIRADKGRVIWGYLAPAKRIFGEKFMVKWREATVKKLEHETPHILKTIRLVDDLKERSLNDITKYFEKGLSAKDLSPAELKAVKGIREVYNDLWGVFGIEKYIKSYSPRLPKFENRQDMIDWTFSRKGVKEFDFWAEHERTGELWNGELNAKKLLLRYIRTGFAKKFYGEALEKVKPIMSGMSKERRQMANKWIDTVIRKQPTAGEVVANRAIRKVLKTAGVKVDENKRYFKDLVGEALDLNYSAYMGLRPKLAMRNLTQQWLIANEYGYGSYLKGRTGKYQDSVKRALENSDVYKLRKKQYLVMEEKIDKISDIPSEIRQKMMWFYRMADLDNVETAFATGYLKAKSLHPNMTEGYAIRAGDKAVHNTQWGYGIDLPYMFKTPGGKFVGQYMSWPIWYLDHIGRIVKERHGAKAARTIVQAAVIGMIAKNTDFDYTRTVLLGAMPTALGYGPQSVLNFVKLVNSFGTWDSKKIKNASKEAGDIILGLVPGYLAAKDIKELGESRDVSKYLLYEKKKGKPKGGLKGL